MVCSAPVSTGSRASSLLALQPSGRYLEVRFGYTTRLLASLAFSLQMILYMGIVLYAPSLALSAVTGLNFTGSVIAVGLVCTFYSSLGGMKAVLMTDVFQSLLMFAAVFTVIGCTCLDAGGLMPVLDNAWRRGRIELLNLSLDPTVRHTVWSQAIGGCFVYCSLYAVNQAQVQRLLALPSLSAGQAALWLQVPILFLLSLSTSLAGLCLLYHYRDCDPLQSGRIRSGDQLLPLYIVDRLAQVPGLAGLTTAGIFSGSLSTVSSAINSLATVTLEDYIRPWLPNLSDKQISVVLKFLAFSFGGVCIALAFLADLLGTGVLQASLTIFGVVGGPLLGLFTLGLLFRRVQQTGAVAGLLSGLALVSWIGFGGPKPPNVKLEVSLTNCTNNLTGLADGTTLEQPDQYFYLYRISYAWTSAIGFTMTIVVGFLVGELVRKVRPPRTSVENILLAKCVQRIPVDSL